MGIVDACGAGTDEWAGRWVVAMTKGAHGGFAEYAICPVVSAFSMPESIPLPGAAALYFPFHLAWLGLFDRADLKAGETVLIHAAAGGYGNGSVDSYAFAEAWDGSTWSVLSTRNPSGDNTFSSVSCSSTDWCVAVGGPLAGAWDGSTWSVESISSPSGGTDSGVYGVSCLSSSSCTAVGGYTSSSGEGLTLAETWDGSTWSVESTPSPKHGSSDSLNDVSCVAPDSCIAAGDYYSTKAASFTSLGEASNGSTWSLYDPPPVLPVTLAPDAGRQDRRRLSLRHVT